MQRYFVLIEGKNKEKLIQPINSFSSHRYVTYILFIILFTGQRKHHLPDSVRPIMPCQPRAAELLPTSSARHCKEGRRQQLVPTSSKRVRDL